MERFLGKLRSFLDTHALTEAAAGAAVDMVYEFLCMERIVHSHVCYQRNDMA